jgi:hypothetical protein
MKIPVSAQREVKARFYSAEQLHKRLKVLGYVFALRKVQRWYDMDFSSTTIEEFELFWLVCGYDVNLNLRTIE